MYEKTYQDHPAFPFGIESLDDNGEVLDCFWYATEAERDAAFAECVLEMRERLAELWAAMPDDDGARNFAGWDEINELEAALAELEGEKA